MKISVNEVTKYIKKALILDNVSLTLEGGHIYGLQGPNGSGKTMLMRMIAGLIRPTSGQVLIDGKALGKGMDFPPPWACSLRTPAFSPTTRG